MSGPRADVRLKSGGALREGMLYVERPADRELLAALDQREFCYVLAPRQIGKSSLRVRTTATLERRGVRSVPVDLTSIGSGIPIPQWYFGFLSIVAEELGLEDETDAFWQRHHALSPVQRFVRFWRELVLAAVAAPIVVFIDEIDAVLALEFPRDDFFAAIRALYNARADDTALDRLTFCLLGVAAPGDLTSDPTRTPFNIGRAIRLEDFTREEAATFMPALAALGGDARVWLDAVYDHTSGHPYMTQKVCEELLHAQARTGAQAAPDPQVATTKIVDQLFLRKSRIEDPNLAAAENHFTHADRNPRIDPMLRLYRRLLDGERVPSDGSDIHLALRLTGMVAERRAQEHSWLGVRNRIFARVFDAEWVKRKEAERYITEPLMRWLSAGRPSDFLLRGQALQAAREWSRQQTDLRPEETEFIMAGLEEARIQEEHEREAARRQAEQERLLTQTRIRRRTLVALAMLLVLLTLALIAVLDRNAKAQDAQQFALRSVRREQLARRQAETAHRQAEAARRQAETARRQAETALLRAERSARQASLALDHAERSAHQAQVAKHNAEQEQTRAQRSAQAARAAQAQAEQAAAREAAAHVEAEQGRLIEKALRARLLSDKPGKRLLALVTAMEAAASLVGASAAPDLPTPDDPVLTSRIFGGLIAAAQPLVAARVLSTQPTAVQAVAFAPDDRYIAIAGDDRRVTLRELPSGRRLASLDGHQGKVRTLSLSPDGSLVLSTSADGTARLWDVQSGAPRGTFQEPDTPIRTAVFSRDGRYLVTGNADGTANAWDVAPPHHRWPLLAAPVKRADSDAPPSIWAADVSPDNLHIALGAADGQVHVVTLDHVPPSQDCRDVADPLRVLRRPALPRTGRERPPAQGMAAIAAGGTSPVAMAARCSAPHVGHSVIAAHNDSVYAVAFAPDASTLASADTRGLIGLWEPRTGQKQVLPLGHDGPVWSIAYAPDGKRIATGGQDGTVRVWNLDTTRLELVLEGHTSAVRSVMFTSRGDVIASGSSDGSVRLWDLARGRAAIEVVHHPTQAAAFASSPDGTRIFTAGKEGAIYQWHPESVLPRGYFLLPPGETTAALAALPGRRLHLISANDTGQVTLWDEQGSPLHRWYLPAGLALATISANGQAALLIDHSYHATLVALPDGKTLDQRYYELLSHAALSRDAKRWITAGADRYVCFWDMRSTRWVRPDVHHVAIITALGLAPQGDFALSGSADGAVFLWDTRLAKRIGILEPHPATVRSAHFDADGQRMVTSSRDGTLRVSRMTHGAVSSLFLVQDPDRTWIDAIFAPDGEQILALDATGQVVRMPISLAGWFAFGCRVLGIERMIPGVSEDTLRALDARCEALPRSTTMP